ncbi:MAG: hypothetical protein Crog4KO_14490 [Crocinitomicaceae bacterium]
MDLKTMEWTIMGLRKEVESLQEDVKDLRLELRKAKFMEVEQKQEDELLNTKEVLNYLGICYNTLQSIIKKGLIEPIRINKRRVKFSKHALMKYINQQKVKLA